MKPSILLIAFLFFAISGGAGLSYFQYQLPDYDETSRDINERLLTIDSLDSSLSALALRSRYNLDSNYDNLVSASSQLDFAVEELGDSYFKDDLLKGSLLERRFNSFKSELAVKMDLIENFKSHNSVLRNSAKYAPIAGRELMEIASQEGLADVANLYSEIVYEVMDYTRQSPADTDASKLREFVQILPDTEVFMPPDSLSTIIEFTNHVATVIQEKTQTEAYLSNALSSTSSSRLDELSKAWSQWVSENNKARGVYRILVIFYVALLLAISAYIAYRLRTLYVSLDKEVAKRALELENAFAELKQSEQQMMQSEKMASLGQLVAGVAHEINTPLGYITSNVEVVKSALKQFGSMLTPIKNISDEARHSEPDKKVISNELRSIIKEYREGELPDSMVEVEELLEDSAFGLEEISKLVVSLKDFSRAEKSEREETDIHSGLQTTIKICNNAIGERKVVTHFSDSVPAINAFPAQLNQVFMNILNNAAQATDPKSGTINVETTSNEDSVTIVFSDNGSGMDEETLSKMFDPFFTTKDVNEGTGLGMSISYKIVQNHGGEIDVKSQINSGTQVTITLPIS